MRVAAELIVKEFYTSGQND